MTNSRQANSVESSQNKQEQPIYLNEVIHKGGTISPMPSEQITPELLSFLKFHLYEFRAQGLVYQRYRINKKELWLLTCLSVFLRRRAGTPIVSKIKFFRQLSGNSKEKRKFEGFMHGCWKKGFIQAYEYKCSPGSFCLGITPLGKKVLTYYEQAFEIVEGQITNALASEQRKDDSRPLTGNYNVIPQTVAA